MATLKKYPYAADGRMPEIETLRCLDDAIRAAFSGSAAARRRNHDEMHPRKPCEKNHGKNERNAQRKHAVDKKN